MGLHRTVFLLTLLLSVHAHRAQAQSYIDITAAPYYANTQCSLNANHQDAGALINQAITAAFTYKQAYASGSTIYFPPGCYLINHQIMDPGGITGNIGGLGIAYLGYGRVEFLAGASL